MYAQYDMLDYKKRCPMPANRTPAVPVGQMHETMERALTQFTELEPHVLSRDPWVLSFDRFLSPDEVKASRALTQAATAPPPSPQLNP